MDNIRLLRFRWQTKEYGVLVKDIIGIARWSWLNGLANYGKPTPLLGVREDLYTGDNKYAIIMNVNGIEMALIVDDIMEITEEMVVGCNEDLIYHLSV